jgi:hypothetical protein
MTKSDLEQLKEQTKHVPCAATRYTSKALRTTTRHANQVQREVPQRALARGFVLPLAIAIGLIRIGICLVMD